MTEKNDSKWTSLATVPILGQAPSAGKVILDARRLLCPMPVIRVQDRVKELSPGTRLEAVCTDPGVLNDIPAWCRINGHRLIETREEGGEYTVVIEVVAEE